MDQTAKMIATLVSDFESVVRHRHASPPQAVAALMATASAILVQDLGEVKAVEMMHSILDEASAESRAGRCAGSC